MHARLNLPCTLCYTHLSSLFLLLIKVRYNMVNQRMLLLLLLLSVSAATMADNHAHSHSWAKTVRTGKHSATTKLRFYFHDTISGRNASAVRVVQPADPATGFGAILMADDPLTEGPDPRSKLVGRAQGLYGSASQHDPQLIMALSYAFIDGPYNGSTINIVGRNSIFKEFRELAVVGGTGFFRMARGYAIAHTHWVDFKTGNAIVGYNVTLLHSSMQ